MWRRSLMAAALAVGLSLPGPSQAGQHLNPLTWAVELAGIPDVQILPMPEHFIVGRDDWGWWTAATQYTPVDVSASPNVERPPGYDGPIYRVRDSEHIPPLNSSAGQWSGYYYCHYFTPCFGATEYIYVLPYKIVGIVGNLTYIAGPTVYQTLSFFDNDMFIRHGMNNDQLGYYNGFFGALWSVPTNVLVVTNLAPSDASGPSFVLTNAQVIVAPIGVPEPSALALLLVGAAGLIGGAYATKTRPFGGRNKPA
ncbi:PEP-CTERM sorting domain-containing protein [Crenalkalicoccus roseus]|uniref:PEP-CTERM sorting domain-containing protein n=1 Tax=Crenalkalicoccus roseus TaxID=1485588 RepID=UPI0013052FD4|nr:PEP-CTERM sorting domain-containing protein [Crenalkalicoccus roseus]